MKKLIFGILLTATTIGTAHADIVRIETAYNSNADIHRFYFIDEAGVETFHDGDVADSFGAALERVINSVGGASVHVETVTGNGYRAVTASADNLNGRIVSNGNYVVTLSNGVVYRYAVDVPTGAPATDVTSNDAAAIAAARHRGRQSYTAATNAQVSAGWQSNNEGIGFDNAAQRAAWNPIGGSAVGSTATDDITQAHVTTYVDTNRATARTWGSRIYQGYTDRYGSIVVPGSVTITSRNGVTSSFTYTSSSGTFDLSSESSVLQAYRNLVGRAVDEVATKAFNSGFDNGWAIGFSDGYDEGFRDGYNVGFTDGVNSVR